jgi:hypothetical protein
MIEKAKSMGIWVENDAFVPQPGDCIMYDWDDSGKGENKNNPDHVGMVEKVSGKTITVIEGNYSDAVKRRNLTVNGKFIRGYITPKFTAYAPPSTTSKPATSTTSKPATSTSSSSLKFKTGDIVEFTGKKHYKSSEGLTGYACKPGKAEITHTNKGKYPYHCVATKDSKGTVYGWVSEADVKAYSKPKEVKASAPAMSGPTNSLSGTYKVTATNGTDIRDNAGTSYKSLVKLSKGATVTCYGYYTTAKGTKWLYVQTTVNGTKYTGFVTANSVKK